MSDGLNTNQKCYCTDITICHPCRNGLAKGEYHCILCGSKMYINNPQKTNDPRNGEICPVCSWGLNDMISRR